MEMGEHGMTALPAFELADPTALPTLAAFFVFGTMLGIAYFSLLRTSARLFANHAPFAALGLTAGRMAVLGLCLYLVSRTGAAPLLVTALGLVVARWVVMRRFSREA